MKIPKQMNIQLKGTSRLFLTKWTSATGIQKYARAMKLSENAWSQTSAGFH
jgi:hypothetical protein